MSRLLGEFQIANKRDTKIGRRNQVLFCIAQLKVYSFSVQLIEEKMIDLFPINACKEKINIPSIIASIIKINDKILYKHEGQNRWEIRDPKFIMTMRMALKKTEQDLVILNHFKLQ